MANICTIGKRLLALFEHIHKAGIVYNDLKPEHIMLTYHDNLPKAHPENDYLLNCQMHLTNFESASSFKESNGKLKERMHINSFQGNTIFASFNQMSFHSTARCDDLISLSYLLVYLLNSGVPKGLDHIEQSHDLECFMKIFETKSRQTIEDLCSNKTEPLK